MILRDRIIRRFNGRRMEDSPRAGRLRRRGRGRPHLCKPRAARPGAGRRHRDASGGQRPPDIEKMARILFADGPSAFPGAARCSLDEAPKTTRWPNSITLVARIPVRHKGGIVVILPRRVAAGRGGHKGLVTRTTTGGHQ